MHTWRALPASVSTVMMTPASTTPASMEPIAGRSGIPSNAAMMAPVHAPVPGAGTPTKRARARERDCPEGSAASLLSARLSSGAATCTAREGCTGDGRRCGGVAGRRCGGAVVWRGGGVVEGEVTVWREVRAVRECC